MKSSGRGAGPWSGLLHHLEVAARVNVLAVLPTTIFLFLLSGQRTPQRFAAVLAAVCIVVNANFLVLNGFYHWCWQPFTSAERFWGPSAAGRRRAAHALFAFVVLPVLGLVAAAIGLAVSSSIGLGVSARPYTVVAISVVCSVIYGVTFFRLEDSRRSRQEALLDLGEARRKQEVAEGERTQAEINALQALIQPHFVFNTLNSIAALIHDQPDRAEEATVGLARIMRHILELRGGSLVTLETEVGIARAYLELEQLRMGDRLRYEISLPQSMLGHYVPAMVLQPLVENAIKHGVRQRLDPGCVWLLVRDDDGECRVQVIDDGPGISSETGTGTGSGMSIVREVLQRIYGEDALLQLERDDVVGQTIVTLRLPRCSPTVQDARLLSRERYAGMRTDKRLAAMTPEGP